jgi:uncharacterized protein (TIGR03067 family)
LVVSVMIVGFGSRPGVADEAAPGDREKIIGVWRGGFPNERKPTYELVITPRKIRGKDLRTGRNLGQGTYRLKPGKKILDATRQGRGGRGRTYLGIYSLKGNTLKWCTNNGGKKRPARLAHRPGDRRYLMILKRRR